MNDEEGGEDDDSRVEFFWQAYVGDEQYADFPVAMFRAFFDGSGRRTEHEVIVFAGWIATSSKWKQFASAWRAVLRQNDVPYFHMKEFAYSAGAFAAGWKDNEPKRRAFLAGLVTAIYDNVAVGISEGVPVKVFDEVNAEYELSEYYGNIYGLSGFLCMSHAHNWVLDRDKRWPMRVSYNFDRGDECEGHLKRLAAQARWPEPQFWASRDDSEKGQVGVIQLQAADFAAYEMFRIQKQLANVDLNQGLLPSFDRKTGELLTAMPNKFLYFDSNGLRHLCRQVGIARR